MWNFLQEIQSQLKAPKWQKNNFWNYKYRSCEDIVEAVKPLLKEHWASLILSDEIVLIWDRYYVKATATIKKGDEVYTTTWFAREADLKKGMDVSQITWAASSYARKYALNWLLAIDDTVDSDGSNDGKWWETIISTSVNKWDVYNDLYSKLDTAKTIQELSVYARLISNAHDKNEITDTQRDELKIVYNKMYAQIKK